MRVYSPHDLLPAKHPSEQQFKDQPDFFYRNVVKHLIPDVIRMMTNGIPIDLDKVSELEATVDTVLESVNESLYNSPLIQEFLVEKYKYIAKARVDELESKKKQPSDLVRVFKYSDKVHRKYFMDVFLKSRHRHGEFNLDEWNVKDLKQLSLVLPSVELDRFIAKELPLDHPLLVEAMWNLATDKANYHNAKYDAKIANVPNEDIYPPFNAGSAIQKNEFLHKYLGIESEKVSKTTGEFSYSREELEKMLKSINSLSESQ